MQSNLGSERAKECIIEQSPPTRQLPFTVDTHLLRELGALLVGRDSTALLELIKNAYDADATTVTVHATGLATGGGALLVSDNGHGMTFEGFQSGFLRIAGRSKETSTRKSVIYGRRFTGAKGIGRLAAHKLASNLMVTSVPSAAVTGRIHRARAEDLARMSELADADERKLAAIAALERAKADDYAGVEASLDWDAMENEHDDLSQLGTALLATPLTPGAASRDRSGPPAARTTFSGTTMLLDGTRDAWTARRRAAFIKEIRSCRPPEVLSGPLSARVVDGPLLFAEATFAESNSNDPGFVLELTGDLSEGEDLWQTLAERADWVLEIESSPDEINYTVAPTRRALEALAATPSDGSTEPWAETRRFFRPQPHANGPFFQARVLVTEGSLGRRNAESGLSAFERQQSGIRVFFEGFRVLPYGADRDDWLGLDRDYVAKQRVLDTPEDLGSEPIEDEGFVQLGNRAYYGAVFLTEDGAPHLQPLINREGFVPDEYFGRLSAIVRTGVDLVTRTRAATTRRVRAAKRAAKNAELAVQDASDADNHAQSGGPSVSVPHTSPEPSRSGTVNPDTGLQDPPPLAHPGTEHDGPSGAAGRILGSLQSGITAPVRQPPAGMRGVNELVESAIAAAADLRVAISGGSTAGPSPTLPVLGEPVEDRGPSAAAGVRQLERVLTLLASYASAATEDQNTLRTVASVGTQFSAFIHELNGLLAQAETVRDLVGALLDDQDLTRVQRQKVRAVQGASSELVASLNRQASYLTDVVGPDARRRRTRMVVRDRAESSVRLVQPRVLDRKQLLEIDIAPELRSPPMFPAEVAIIFTNLLTNAIKFAGADGRIRVSAFVDADAQLVLRVENTGTAVAAADRERFFRPFESSSTDVDVVLGQGMGLGLTIVRNVADDYSGQAYFAEPSDGFATAVEVVIPDPRPDVARKGLRSGR